MADLTNEEALQYVHDRFRRMGVERALERAGAREGDVVRIGQIELEYVPEGGLA
jgi:GTP-binding protein